MLLQAKTNGMVTFIYELKGDAQEVYLAGSFNQWHPKAKQMLKARDGSFRTIMELPPGQHHYKFVVDGVWHDDPDAPHRFTNSFGTLNSGFVVGQKAL